MSNVNYQSKAITQAQTQPHKNLEKIVNKHLTQKFRKPFCEHNVNAFNAAQAFIKQHANKPIILDSGCGTGHSTLFLAQRFPDSIIIGVDKSEVRLNKHPESQNSKNNDNYILLRADLDDFWRLASQANWKLDQHFILYPNPWPKSTHFKRRFHGSPVFKYIIELGGKLELRSNWQLYLREFAQALQLANICANVEKLEVDGEYMTLFEKKYHLSQQTLWRCTANLG